MEWTFEEFFAVGGTTTFVDRVTASLGIHASTIKVVSVYEGSLVVLYDLTPSDQESRTLEELRKLQVERFAKGLVDLGAPLLDVSADRVPIITDGVVTAPGYDRIIITPTPSN